MDQVLNLDLKIGPPLSKSQENLCVEILELMMTLAI